TLRTPTRKQQRDHPMRVLSLLVIRKAAALFLIVTFTYFLAAETCVAQALPPTASDPGEKRLVEGERQQRINDLVTRIEHLKLWQDEVQVLKKADTEVAKTSIEKAEITIKKIRPGVRAHSTQDLRAFSAAQSLLSSSNSLMESIRSRQAAVTVLKNQ